MTLDIHRSNDGRVSTIMKPGKMTTSSSGRAPLQARNPNSMRSFGNNSSEELSKQGLSNLESSNNEMNKKLTSSASYANSSHLRRVSSNSETRDVAEVPASSTSRSSWVPRPEVSTRSSSDPTAAKVDGDSVIIEEKRKKANGDGYTLHRYLRGRLLGKGGFAKVYLCTAMDTNKTYAIKIVPKANLVKARARQKLQAEIKIHRTLKHKYVCEYKHFFEDRQNCYILLELCHNQSMNELIKRRKRLTEPEAAFFMQQLLQAIQYLHQDQLVIHRDLKLGNLFLDKQMNIKVGDLGLATRLDSLDDKRKTICGTPNYIAPEVIQGDRATRGHSFEVDVWSMGVILYTWLVGKPPYEAKDVKATYQRILNNEYSFPSKLSISDNARALITSMLRSKPSDRPSLDVIALHPFFTDSFIPLSLPATATHVAPKWDKADMKAGYGSGLRHPNLPLSSRRPFSYRDVNVEPVGAEKPKTSKSQMASIDVPGVVKNVVSAVMGVSSKTVEKQSFKVFDETDKTSEEEIVSRTAAMSIRTQSVSNNPSPHSDDLSSPTSDDAFILHNMIDRIDNVLDITSKRSYANVNADSITLRAFSTGGPEKWVARYVDYTSKYGLGFLLSDGSSGVYFNDSTKAILEANGNCFQYIERKASLGPMRRDEPVIGTHNLSKYPDDLQKKVTLLKHFRNYLIEQKKKSDALDISSQASASQVLSKEKTNLVYLKKWVRTKHAIFFRLSDNTVQIVFYDHTEIVLTPDERHITYSDKNRERKTYYLTDELVGTNSEISKRLKYTKEILLQLVTGKPR